MTSQALPAAGLPHMDLPGRLDALAELVKIGRAREGVDPALVGDTEALLRRAGERLRLSAAHTVVALAGGTGSGKSSLFNALSGANFSPAGVTRPTTRHVHACVWGMQGAAPLLDWLGVQRRHRYARASALDAGEVALSGLLLLDLPDHDSVVSASMAAVDRLSKLADMIIWVLDPQKYADAAVHRRYLIPLAGHAKVITVALNQADLLTAEQVADCESDLRRLLDSEGLGDVRLLPVSARTGAGLDDLRAVLTEAVTSQNSVSDRICADIDAVTGGFAAYSNGAIAASLAGPDVAVLAEPGSTADAAARITADADLAESAADTAAGDDLADSGVPDSGVPEGSAFDGSVFDRAATDGSVFDGAATDGSVFDGAATDGSVFDGAATDGTARTAALPRRGGRPPWEDATPDGIAKPALAPLECVPAAPAGELVGTLARAAGVTAVTDAMQGVREAQAARYVGWPLARLARRRSKMRGLRQASREASAGLITAAATLAQRSDIDNAITAFADEVADPMPAPWSRTVREAARSRSSDIQHALGIAITESVRPHEKAPGWWRLIWLLQRLLIVAVLGGLAWIGLIIAFGYEHVSHGHEPALLTETSLIPWLGVMAVAVLLLGWLTAAGCQNAVLLAADRERDTAEREMRARLAGVTQDYVLTPTGREIAEYERFRQQLTLARG